MGKCWGGVEGGRWVLYKVTGFYFVLKGLFIGFGVCDIGPPSF